MTKPKKSETEQLEMGCCYLYSIRDVKQPRHFPPFDSFNDAVAMRHFKSMGAVENSIFASNPSDFELWRVGIFDTCVGEIKSADRTYVCSALDIIDLNVE